MMAFISCDRQGKYLCDVGAIGQGPGEYSYPLYDYLIDEKGGHIFFTPFTLDNILVYGLDSKWIKDIKLPLTINKPKIVLNRDGTLSVVHMAFNEKDPCAFQVDMDGNILKLLPVPPYMIVNSFDSEIFSHHTSVNTTYQYDAASNRLLPRFTMQFPNPETGPIHI